MTIVGNDCGGAMSQVLVTRHPERIGRLVLTNCDTHENFPPGHLQGDAAARQAPGRHDGALGATFRIGALARAAFKPFAKKQIPAELIASWMAPGLNDPGVNRDLKKVTVGMNKRYTLEAAEKLRDSDLPILLTWAPGDKFFPIKYAERLAEKTPNARIVEIPDSKTFVPLDQPQRLADEIATFVDGLKPRQNVPIWGSFSLLACFSSDGGAMLFVTPPHRGRRAMPKEIFDQDRPRSTMARASTKPSRVATSGRPRRRLSGAASRLSPGPRARRG